MGISSIRFHISTENRQNVALMRSERYSKAWKTKNSKIAVCCVLQCYGWSILPQRRDGQRNQLLSNDGHSCPVISVKLFNKCLTKENGASSNMTCTIRSRSDKMSSKSWIWRYCPTAWPASSPDLAPSHVFLFWFGKIKVSWTSCPALRSLNEEERRQWQLSMKNS